MILLLFLYSIDFSYDDSRQYKSSKYQTQKSIKLIGHVIEEQIKNRLMRIIIIIGFTHCAQPMDRCDRPVLLSYTKVSVIMWKYVH